MSAIEPPDNLLEIRNATMRVSRIESNTQTMTANLEVGTTLAVSGNTTLSSNLVVGGNVSVGTANLFVDTVSSNVGVGTNLPLAKLDVKGDIGLVGNIYSDSNLSVQYTTENPSNTWAQVGGDLNGEAVNDRFGWSVALSSDGTRLAAGAYSNDANGVDAGHVRVFDLVGGAWTQVGGDIDGEAAGDSFGVSVALSSDGTRLAVGGYLNDGGGTDAGHVRVFNWSGSAWIQLGADIDGEAAGDNSGYFVALSSDGTRLAVGVIYNDGTGTDAGHVRVFEYHQGSSSWIQLGADIDGEAAGDRSGWSVDLSSDGTRLAVGAYLNDGTGTDAGHVRVFEYHQGSSSWIQLGADIDGEAAGDEFGWSVALSSDGSRLAVGGRLNDGNGSNAGHVRVFDLVGGTWTQVGDDIDGEAASDLFGSSVALSSDGTRLAVGALGNDGTGTDAGHARVFDLVGGAWTQIGGDLDGAVAGDYFSQSVALSSDGTRLAVGGPLNDSPGSNAGHVRVFDYDGVLKTKQIIKEDIVEIPGDLRAGCPVFFQAAATGSTINATQLIPYNNVLNNKGGGYNPSTRLFTAPIAGFYHFSFYHMSHNSVTEGVFTLNGTAVKAGGTPIRVHSNVGGAHSPASASLNVYMNASDTMGIMLTLGNMYMSSSQYAGFNGFYLSS
jgi:hypothetical protein